MPAELRHNCVGAPPGELNAPRLSVPVMRDAPLTSSLKDGSILPCLRFDYTEQNLKRS